jgi:tetratricopeptide (TPR) repeat protein
MSSCKKDLRIWELLGATPLLLFGTEFIRTVVKLPAISQPAIAQPAPTQIIAQNPSSPALSQGNALLDGGYEQSQKGQLREALESYRRALESLQQPGGDAAEQLLKAEGAGIARQSMGLVYARLGQLRDWAFSVRSPWLPTPPLPN